MKQKTTTINQKILIPATPNQVYEAYIDPKLHSKFTGSKATGKAVVGAKFTAWDGYISGKYLELEKDKRIVQEWVTTDWPEGYLPSKVEFTLKATKEGTELTMKHSEVPTIQEDELKEGWTEFYWEPMKTFFIKQ
jgi:activator of HSP90 ATPase